MTFNFEKISQNNRYGYVKMKNPKYYFLIVETSMMFWYVKIKSFKNNKYLLNLKWQIENSIK